MAPQPSKSQKQKPKTIKKVRFAADTKEDASSAQKKGYGSTKITVEKPGAQFVQTKLTREVLQSQGWDIQQIPTGFGNYCIVASRCTLPSPLVEKPTQREELLAIGSNYTYVDISRSLTEFSSVRNKFRTEFTSGDALLSDGSRARLLTAGKDHDTTETKARSFGWTEKSPGLKRIPINTITSDQKDMNAGKTFEIRRIFNSDSSHGYFVMNIDLAMLTVNEMPVDVRTAVGPLSDFAIITIGSLVVLFWRVRAALSYVPISREPKPKAQAEPRSQLTAFQKGRQQTYWQTILDYGLTYWRPIRDEHRRRNANRDKNDPNDPDKQPTVVNTLEDWADDQVLLAIASVWEGLRQEEILFAYAGQDVFTPVGIHFDQYGVVGRRNTFIMPLMLPSENQDQAMENNNLVEDVGHLLLGVAEILPSEAVDEVLQVQVTIYDSAPYVTDKDRVKKQVRDQVDKWLGADSEHVLSFMSKPVPGQQKGNTCGLHTVLSAWAVMLGIPIHGKSQRRATRANADFYPQSLEIINLALAGCMDSRTIQAFMNVHGFSIAQRPNSPGDRAVKMNASRMDTVKFADCLQDQLESDLVAAFEEIEQNITDDQVTGLRELVGDEPPAEDLNLALVVNAGDRDKAAHRIWNPPHSPSPPPERGPPSEDYLGQLV